MNKSAKVIIKLRCINRKNSSKIHNYNNRNKNNSINLQTSVKISLINNSQFINNNKDKYFSTNMEILSPWIMLHSIINRAWNSSIKDFRSHKMYSKEIQSINQKCNKLIYKSINFQMINKSSTSITQYLNPHTINNKN